MECNNCYDRTMNSYNNNINSVFPNKLMFGHAYTPNQTMNKIFMPEEGLRNGTMYPELVSPYEPCQSMEEIRFLAGGRR